MHMAALSTICLLLSVTVANAQSLGEIAEKEKQRRKSNQGKPVKLITEKDLRQGSGEATSASGGKAAAENAPGTTKTDTLPAQTQPGSGESSTGTATGEKSRSSVEEMRERAAAFEPKIVDVSAKADKLEADFRRYVDGCYQKYASVSSSGISSGVADVSSYGGASGRTWFAVWTSTSDIAWSESWVAQSSVSNETTAPCRFLWSDIVANATSISRDMETIQEEARRAGVLPGHLRELRRKYRLDWSGWDR